MPVAVYIYNDNNNNKIRFVNFLGEGRSRAYRVLHQFKIARRTK